MLHMRKHILSLPISSVDCATVTVQLCETFVDARCLSFCPSSGSNYRCVLENCTILIAERIGGMSYNALLGSSLWYAVLSAVYQSYLWMILIG